MIHYEEINLPLILITLQCASLCLEYHIFSDIFALNMERPLQSVDECNRQSPILDASPHTFKFTTRESAICAKSLKSMTSQYLLNELSRYFSKMRHDALPQSNLFSWENNPSYAGVFILKYIFPFATSTIKHHKDYICDLLTALITHNKQVVAEIAALCEQKQVDMRYYGNHSTDNTYIVQLLNLLGDLSFSSYLSRLMAVPTVLANLLSSSGCGGRDYRAEEIVIAEALVEQIDKFSGCSQRQILNKVLVLGYHKTIIDGLISANNIQIFWKHLSGLTKRNKIFNYLYSRYLEQSPIETAVLRKMMQTINVNDEAIGALNLEECLHEDCYISYYELLCSPEGPRQSIMQHLLAWWMLGKSSLLPVRQAMFRCNVLALCIEHSSKEQLMQKHYLEPIITGIEKKLVDPAEKDLAALVWKKLATVMGFKVDKHILSACYFVIQSVNTVNRDTADLQKLQYESHESQQNHTTYDEFKKQSEESSSEDECYEPDQQTETDLITLKLKEPKNIYDCILGLRTPSRIRYVLSKLPKLLKRNPQDAMLQWKQLLRELFTPLREQYHKVLTTLCTLRPNEFIQEVSSIYFKKETNINEKIILMKVLDQCVSQLGNNPALLADPPDDSDFYFKKIASRYFVEEAPQKTQKQRASRRWGHTRIVHARRETQSTTSLLIVPETYVNRFYEIADLLFFKLVSPMRPQIQSALKKHQLLVHYLLALLATITQNIKNHYKKYTILLQVTEIILQITHFVKQTSNSVQQSNVGQTCDRTVSRVDDNSNSTVMLTIQLLLRVSLVIDKHVPASHLSNLKAAVVALKHLPNYGIRPLLDLVQENVYRNMALSRDQI